MKTLIIYATKHGTAAKCAFLLSQKLVGGADMVDIKKGKVPDLARYEKIIIGGSIYIGRIQKEISAFCVQNLDLLKDRKIGVFICSIFKDNVQASFNASFPQELLAKAAAKENFGGEMRFSDMNFAEKAMTKMVSKTIAKDDASVSDITGKKDVSLLLEENIDRFIRQINSSEK